ncbi:hypothetical protein LDENG_00258620 [Lucifuga dentata]|nr:hypothetical protein LDENG_00258620 [Lucifuga dentata]
MFFNTDIKLSRGLTANTVLVLKDHNTHFACLSLIYSLFIHVMLLTIISKAYYWNGIKNVFPTFQTSTGFSSFCY